MRNLLISSAVIAAAVFASPVLTNAWCPFCEAPSLTLTEQLNQADVAVLVQWV